MGDLPLSSPIADWSPPPVAGEVALTSASVRFRAVRLASRPSSGWVPPPPPLCPEPVEICSI